MRIKTGLTAAALAAACLVAPAASAAEPTYSAQNTKTASGHTLVQIATGELLESDSSGRTIAVNCTATALPDGVATGVAACYLLGANGRHYSATDGNSQPGPVDMAAAVLEVPRQTYRLCMRSNALFQQGTYAITGSTICSPSA